MLEELSVANPRARLSDSIPTGIKILWKKLGSPLFGNPYYHTIIPRTFNHGEWILGAQPDLSAIRGLLAEQNTSKVHIVSMLGDDETVISDKSIDRNHNIERSRVRWFDHSTLDRTTGRNQLTEEMVNFQQNFYDDFFQEPHRTTFYCHCMAGRSRSLLETLGFIYFCPVNKRDQLFDFENWPAEITEKIPEDLRRRLRNDPSFRDISEFVSTIRSKAKKFEKLDGDQAGFLGLMTLIKIASGFVSKEQEWFLQNASDIGLMLKAPLDTAFRDATDREEQESKLVSVVKTYNNRGINLLEKMIIPHRDREQNLSKSFEEYFSDLPASEQARFAILAYRLEQKDLKISLPKESIDYARIAAENLDELTVGDQIELLKTFGLELLKNPEESNRVSEAGYTQSIIDKVLRGNPLDRYNQSDRLLELWKAVSPAQQGRVETAVNSMDYRKQINFVQRLAATRLDDAKRIAKTINENYQKKWFRVFYNPFKKEMSDLSSSLDQLSVQDEKGGSSSQAAITDKLLESGQPEGVVAAIKPDNGTELTAALVGAEKVVSAPPRKEDAYVNGDVPSIGA